MGRRIMALVIARIIGGTVVAFITTAIATTGVNGFLQLVTRLALVLAPGQPRVARPKFYLQ